MPRKQETAWEHPPPERLRAFECGTLLEERVPEIEAHLAACAPCCEALAALPDDGFLTRLRHAYQTTPAASPPAPSPTPSPAATPGGLTLRGDGSAGPHGPPSLPGFDSLRELGRGGMGVVYAARHGLMGRRVAVKVIHPELARHPAAAERFRREAQAVARLVHPHIVTAYDAGQCGDQLFLVMEHIDGESLAERLRRQGPLAVAEACEAVRQAALGVQHAHDSGLVHRDLKPHNLLRTAEGTVKVCDFGLAALADDRGRPAGTTAPNVVLGTPDYMAPEQAEDARRADGRADVYSLGCTLYHLLTGEVPFTEESTLLKLLAHRTHERPSARRLRPEVPAGLDTVLRRTMARQPGERPPTPGALAQALAPFVDPARIARRGRIRTLLALAAAVLLAATAAAGVTRLPAGKGREIVIETDDPTVEVVVKGDRIARIVDPQTGKVYRLDRQDLTLSLLDDPDGLAVALDGRRPMVLKRQGRRIATVRLEPPAGIAPAKVGQARPFENRLFNGKDLTGWVVDGGPAGAWWVQNGELVGAAPGYRHSGFLLTERSYSDFQLRFEFQLSPGANSGVALRAVPGERHSADNNLPDHLEVQILDDREHLDGHTGSLYWSRSGFFLRPDRSAALGPAGSWNRMTIESRGGRLQVRVNGGEVLNTDLTKLAKQSDAKPGLKRSSGRIGFQQHTGEVRFRNIEIQALPQTGKVSPKRFASFFNGKDLAGWQGLPGYWSVEGGAIVGACPPGRPEHTFLVSKRAYKDFDLKFQARRLGGIGNSGVQFRSRLVDPGRLTVVGPQCEIDSAGHRFPPGSLLTEPDLKPLAVKAPRGPVAALYRDDDFNDFHIRCVGKHVTIKVNGVTTVDDDYPELPNEGVIAWQMHGWWPPRQITFRSIEFTDLGEEFRPLPLRQDLSGWLIEGAERAFRAEGGVLVATSPGWEARTYLLSEQFYADYRLRFECRLDKGANLGVVVRGHRGERSDFERPGAIDHPVIKLTDSGAFPHTPPGATHWVASGSHDGPRSRLVSFPVGEWNVVEIEVRGPTCQVWVNNAFAVTLALDEENRSGRLLAGLARERGNVGFQANTGTARFRNIEIQELPR